VAERSKAADCKSVSNYSRWFESNLSQFIYFYKNYQKISSFLLKNTHGRNNYKTSATSLKKQTTLYTGLRNVRPILSTKHTISKIGNYNYNNLVLNYKRLRFFPLIRDSYGQTLFNCSLGVIAKYLNKGKSFTKKKAVYLLLFSLIRKILLYSKINDMILVLNRTPKYLQEFMTTLNTPSVSIYSNPFKASELLSESSKDTYFDFKFVQVITSKSYGYIKMGKRGRLKRKISKRVQASNRVLD
jgi:hypothetical protein